MTETWDLEGSIIETKPVGIITRSQLEEAVFSFIGEIVQTPPVFSAKKISGKPAYYYARNDTGHEQLKRLKASNVSIYSIEIESFDGLDGIMSICCSSGTYVRSIINDLGKMLGCGATLTHLTRDSIGKFERIDSIHADDIEKIVEGITGPMSGVQKTADEIGEMAPGSEKNSDSENTEKYGAGIWSVEKILRLKYL